ncbi:MAG: GHMP kinase [Bacteroidetes bacterium]|nr:GHMP kinase [Bacteroidota bacterium]
MKSFFQSCGKLLLTGEYAILDGATGLALPTKYGQSMTVCPAATQQLTWKSFDNDGKIWYEAVFSLSDIIKNKIVYADDFSVRLLSLFTEIQRQNPLFFKASEGFYIETHLDFPRQWGLGTSATLVANLANWAKVDAFELLFQTFGGSGYDVAVAQQSAPILYELDAGKPRWKPVLFQPSFSGQLFFVYLNQKQNSRSAIAWYRQKKHPESFLKSVTACTQSILQSKDIESFSNALTQHENLLAEALGIPSVKAQMFSDYPYAMKSLGAWGGDFVLAVGDEKTAAYFKAKGCKTVIPYAEMIKSI